MKKAVEVMKYNHIEWTEFEEYKDERGADKTSRKQRCGDRYRKI
ncbi:hypothetical protein [Butyrivibrio sp. INlla14]|nr:hypothetical protein [Butyrivibrio sp. INlla14]